MRTLENETSLKTGGAADKNGTRALELYMEIHLVGTVLVECGFACLPGVRTGHSDLSDNV